MRTVLRALVMSAGFLAVATSQLSASRADVSGLDAHNTVIIWDGERDVPVSQGDGDISTLGSLALNSIADYAVLVTEGPLPSYVRPIHVTGLRLVLRGAGFTAACGPAVVPAPQFCARIHPLADIISRQSLHNLKLDNSRLKRYEDVGALPAIGLNLIPAELPGLWRLALAEQNALAEMAQILGADNIRVGFDSEIEKDPGWARSVAIRDFNYPRASGVSVDAVAPATGPSAGGSPITITGRNFAAGATVTLGGVAASNVAVVNANTITATTPAKSAGPASVVVTIPGAPAATLTNGFTYVALVSNDSFTNRFALTGFGAMTATGSNVGSTAESGEPSDLVAAGSGTASVWWTWTAPCSFDAASPASFIDTIGSSFDTVLGVFTGSNLASLTRVASDDDSGGSLSSRVPSATPGPSYLAIAAGTVFQIRVRSYGTSTGSITLHVNSPCAPPPTLTAVRPGSSPAGIPGTTITITGANFVPGAKVTLGAVAGEAVVLSSTTILTSVNSSAPPGPVNVTVTNPDGQSGGLANGFTYLAFPQPTISGVSPAFASINGTINPLDTITVMGTNFVSGLTVLIDGTPVVLDTAGDLPTPTSTSARVTYGPHPAGVVSVTVINPGGKTATLANAVAFRAPGPSFGPFPVPPSPSNGSIAGGTTVIITGFDFVTGATVTVGGTAATNVSVLNPSTISARTSAHAAGIVAITVTNPDTQSATLDNSFTYVGPPAIVTNIFPRSGPVAGGTPVTISGSNFAPGAAVLFNGVFATNVTVVSPTMIKATTSCPTGPCAPGAVTVTVRNHPTTPDGTLPGGYTYLARPSNDHFADRFPLVGPGSLTATGSLASATAEVLEPSDGIATGSGTPSLWWTWTAPCSFSVSSPDSFIDTTDNESRSASADTVLGVFTGSTLATLALVASDDDSGISLLHPPQVPNPFSQVPSPSPGPSTMNIAAGAVLQIRVRGYDGTEIRPFTLRINSPCPMLAQPAVSAITPPSGPSAGGSTVTITGSNFASGAAVSIGGAPATNVAVLSASTITAITPTHVAKPADVVVTNPDGQTGSLVSGYTYIASAPVVTHSPTSTAVTPGRTAAFAAAAVSLDAFTAQWQISRNGGGTWSDIPGAVNPGYSIVAALTDNGAQLRCVFTNSIGTTVSATAALYVRDRVSVPTDVDGDGLGDLTLWRPGNGTWYWLTSSSAFDSGMAGTKQWGSQAAGDVPLLGDIDGDGMADLIVWRASTGTWFWLTSSSGYSYAAAGGKQWGNLSLGDVPLLGDVDGDGRADLIVWRASSGTWFWLTSSTGYDYARAGMRQWGSKVLGDVPKIGDMDGDGRADLVVWRASTGVWYWLTSSSGYNAAGSQQWGNSGLGDVPLLGDMDGDGRSDLVVWRASSGTFFWLESSTGYSYAGQHQRQWGSMPLGDVPSVRDLDGDGKADLVVWRGSTGVWFWITSSTAFDYNLHAEKQWGIPGLGDIPVR